MHSRPGSPVGAHVELEVRAQSTAQRLLKENSLLFNPLLSCLSRALLGTGRSCHTISWEMPNPTQETCGSPSLAQARTPQAGAVKTVGPRSRRLEREVKSVTMTHCRPTEMKILISIRLLSSCHIIDEFVRLLGHSLLLMHRFIHIHFTLHGKTGAHRPLGTRATGLGYSVPGGALPSPTRASDTPYFKATFLSLHVQQYPEYFGCLFPVPQCLVWPLVINCFPSSRRVSTSLYFSASARKGFLGSCFQSPDVYS